MKYFKPTRENIRELLIANNLEEIFPDEFISKINCQVPLDGYYININIPIHIMIKNFTDAPKEFEYVSMIFHMMMPKVTRKHIYLTETDVHYDKNTPYVSIALHEFVSYEDENQCNINTINRLLKSLQKQFSELFLNGNPILKYFELKEISGNLQSHYNKDDDEYQYHTTINTSNKDINVEVTIRLVCACYLMKIRIYTHTDTYDEDMMTSIIYGLNQVNTDTYISLYREYSKTIQACMKQHKIDVNDEDIQNIFY